jgi:hypothetical protein
MDVTLPLAEMSVVEKLRTMEALWADLSRNEGDIPVADWHKELLDERKRQIDAGEARFTDWETAKKRIRDQAS